MLGSRCPLPFPCPGLPRLVGIKAAPVPLLSAPEPGPGEPEGSLPFLPEAGEPASSRPDKPARPPLPRLPPERGARLELLIEVVVDGALMMGGSGLGVALSSTIALVLGVSVDSSGISGSSRSYHSSNDVKRLLTIYSPSLRPPFPLVCCI